MRRILFVDDEPAILAGLRRSLRSLRNEWEMEFVESGAEALSTLEGSHFDVVVSDMRMPGMDGVGLLSQIKAAYPDVIRIVLSGHTDRGSTMKATGVTHQYLAKPTDPDELITAIRRATQLEDSLANERVARATGGLESLPPMPALYAEVAEELAGDDPSIDHVAKIVAKDPGMASKVVQIVNSSFFGMRTRITDPEQAVALLGLDTVVGLILTGPFSQTSEGPGSDDRWMNGLATAGLAKRVCQMEGSDKQAADDAYLAGLLHDCGRTIVAAQLPREYARIEQEARGGEFVEAEHKVLGASHAEIGAYILGIWGLPAPVIEAVLHHHNPSQGSVSGFGPLTAVHAAAVIVSNHAGDHPCVLDEDHLESVGKTGRFDEWQSEFEPPEELAS